MNKSYDLGKSSSYGGDPFRQTQTQMSQANCTEICNNIDG